MDRKNVNELVVNRQKIQTRIEEIDIFKLHYWKENPRVNSLIKQNFGDKDISDEDIEKLLWDKVDSVHDLYQDIKKHGGLIDEILIRDNVVLEGNSRLCAYRHLYKKSEQNNDDDEMLKWSYIRARILPEETSNETLFSILGTWHIRGKTKWDTYEKAAYFKRMNVAYGVSLKDIASSISGTEKFVKDHIEAYDLMIKYEDYTLDRFSYYYELVKNKKIKELTYKDPNIFTNTIQAIKEDRFKRGEDIRDLHKVLNDKKAKKEFFEEKVDFNYALETTKDRHPEHEDSFYNHIIKTTQLLKECQVQKIEEIKNDGNKKYILRDLYKESERLYKKIEK